MDGAVDRPSLNAVTLRSAGLPAAQLAIERSDFRTGRQSRSNVRHGALNYRLHFFIYEIAELPQTLHFVQVLWARYPFDLIHGIPGRVSRAAEELAELLDQLIQGDVSGAMLTMRQHIEAGWSELRDHLQKSDTAPQAKNSTLHSVRKTAR